jgi:hypothetical protein
MMKSCNGDIKFAILQVFSRQNAKFPLKNPREIFLSKIFLRIFLPSSLHCCCRFQESFTRGEDKVISCIVERLSRGG